MIPTMFTAAHWDALIELGYTVVKGAVSGARLRDAQDAAIALNDRHPDGGWRNSSTAELWREIHRSEHPAFLTIAAELFDPLAVQLLDSVRPGDRLQLAATLPGYRTDNGIGKHFHIDGGRGPSLAVFNLLFGVALSPVESDSDGGLHLLPGSHERFAEAFRQQPIDTDVHWGNVKLATLGALLAEGAPMAVPQLQPGDLVVAHGFTVHGVSSNATDRRRDMLYQRRVALPLADPVTQPQARLAFMRDPWAHFGRPR